MRSAVTLSFAALLWSIPAWAQPDARPSTDMVPRTSKAVGYPVGGGSTMVDLKSVGTLPASGQAKVEAKPAVTMVLKMTHVRSVMMTALLAFWGTSVGDTRTSSP